MYKFLTSIIFCCVIIFCLNYFYPYILKDQKNLENIIYSIISLFMFLSYILTYPIKIILKGLGLFFAMITICLLVYSYKEEIMQSKFMSVLLPTKPITNSDGKMILTAGEGGHFKVQVKANNYNILCLIDTGATGILIDPNDAQNMGFDLNSLNYDVISNTANGIGSSARVLIKDFSLGSINLNQVEAMVNKEKLGPCLLGMSFLSKLKSFTINGNHLILEP